MTEIKKASYFENLDSLRSIACLIVLLAHTLELTKLSLPGNNIDLFSFFLNGGNGVQIFFTLSGFLITYLLLHEEATEQKINVSHFYLRRILRIWPMYFFTLFVGFGVYPALKAILNQDLNWAYHKLAHFFFLSNFDIYNVEKFYPGQDAAIIDITWSVSIEEQFYLVWPLILMIPLNKKWRIGLLIILSIFSLSFQVVNHSNPELNYFSTWSCALNLIGGGLLACTTYSYIQGLSKLFIPKAVNVFCYISIVVFVIFKLFPMDYLLYRWLLLLSVLYVILEQTVNQNSFFSLRRVPLLQGFSKFSYSVYLVHPMVQLAVTQISRMLHVMESAIIEWIKFVIIVALSIIASVITYTLIEKKFLALKKKFA